MDGLLKQYVAMVPVRSIQWPQGFSYSVPEQTALFEEVWSDGLCVKYPPSRSYQMHFIKHVMTSAEDRGHSVASELYELYAALVAVPESGEADFCYKSYCINPHNSFVTLKESTKLISQGTTGLTTWQAAFYLVEWASSGNNMQFFRGKSILELGAGLGFTGIALCLLCHPSRYTFTDCHDDVLHVLKENVGFNLSASEPDTEVEVSAFNWEQQGVEGCLCRGKVDCIVATDVVYDTEIVDDFVQAIHKLLSKHINAVALVASTIRNPSTYRHFCEKLDATSIRWKVAEKASCEIFYYDRTLPIEILELSL